MVFDLAWASTGGTTGIETAMQFIVSLILAVAGAGVVAAVAWRGLQLVWASAAEGQRLARADAEAVRALVDARDA